MKSRHLKTLALSLCLASVAGVAWGEMDTSKLTVQDIVKQQNQLRAQAMAGKGPFKGMAKRERDEMVTHQDRVLTMIGDRKDLDGMSTDQRTELYNELQWIDATLAKAQDERMICEQTRSVGSNRVQSVCMTAAQRERLRQRAQSEMQKPMNCATNDLGRCN